MNPNSQKTLKNVVNSATYHAPAKIILLGEHAVVYGQPAIAVPFNTLQANATVTALPAGSGLMLAAHDLNETLHIRSAADLLNDDQALIAAIALTLRHLEAPIPDAQIDLRASIPLASGFGSGAAIATALIRAVAAAAKRTLADADLNLLVFAVEKLHHGTPSGIDNTVIVYNRPVYFVRESPPAPFAVAKPMTFVIANTGLAAPTKETVAAVRTLVERDPSVYRTVIEQIGQVVEEARRQIEKGYLLGVGHLMNLNHNCLQQLTVSSPLLDRLCKVAREAGAVGAKLSGGGRGGNMIALVAPMHAEAVAEALRAEGAAQTWIMQVDATQ